MGIDQEITSPDDLKDLVRRYRWVILSLSVATLFYLAAFALDATWLGHWTGYRFFSFGPCGDPSCVAVVVFAIVKLISITSVVRLSNQLGDPPLIGILQFLLMFPFLTDLLVLAVAAYRGKSRLRFAMQGALGFCVQCGYNLTGNTSGICPECGTAIAEKTADRRPIP